MSMIHSLSIKGYRGYSKPCIIKLAKPNGESGSGITFIVGANNSGKTTIIESFLAFNNAHMSHILPSFSEGKRNKPGDYVKLCLTTLDSNQKQRYTIESLERGTSQCKFMKNEEYLDVFEDIPAIHSLRARRLIDFDFDRSELNKDEYSRLQTGERNQRMHNFNARLFTMFDKKTEIKPIIDKLLGFDFDWVIDQRDSGHHYLKVKNKDFLRRVEGVGDGIRGHSGEGVGDGIWSILTICDLLYDSKEGSLLIIDEPELSLHPPVQRRLMKLIKEYAKDRQIVLCTHSPYFIDWESLINGGKLIRTVKSLNTDLISAYSMSVKTTEDIRPLLDDLHKPYLFDLLSKEIFFLEDCAILVEGMEDIVIYNKILDQLELKINGEFFGWGIGGAGNVTKFLNLFKDLGYEKVAIILDGDQEEFINKIELERNYPPYLVKTIPANDIRDKNETEGITFSDGTIKE